jgi:hypothetical protein
VITLCTAVRDDFKGLFFSIHSALLQVQGTPLEKDFRIAVLNNSSDPYEIGRIRELAQQMKGRMEYKETTILSNHYGRNEAIKMAKTKYAVLCDCHILFGNNFFQEYIRCMEENPEIGLLSSPFTCGGCLPWYGANSFYNLQKFERNLHGSFSHRGASDVDPYPAALPPHPALGLRVAQWNEYGGYINECLGNGGGEPFVTFKYWMLGSKVFITPRTGFVHYTGVPYKRSRGQWRKNHALAALALAGLNDTGVRYVKCFGYFEEIEALWKIAKPYNDFIKSKQVMTFEELIPYFQKEKVRPWI